MISRRMLRENCRVMLRVGKRFLQQVNCDKGAKIGI